MTTSVKGRTPSPEQQQPAPWRTFLGKPARGPARWVLAAAIFGAVIGTSFGLQGVLLDFSWVPKAMVVVAFTVLVPALFRRYPRLGPFAPLGAFLGWLVGLTLVFFPGTAFLAFIPTQATLNAAIDLAQDASVTILVNTAPVPPSDGVVFALCAGLGFTALVIDTLAVTLAMPATSGVGIVLILLPEALTTADGITPVGFAFAAAGYLLILGCCRWYAPEGQLRPAANRARSGTLARAAGLGAAVVLVISLLPAAIPGFTTGTFPQGTRLGAPGDVSGLDPMISLGNSLRVQSGSISMTYLSTSTSPLYIRVNTLEDFSGKNWRPSPVPRGLPTDLNTLVSSFSPNRAVPTTEITTVVNTDYFSSTWLPAPATPISVTSLQGLWSWNPSTQTVQSETDTTNGQSYVVVSEQPNLTPALLRAATAKPRDGLDPVFSTLPANVPDIIEKTAGDVTRGAATPFDKAMLLQDYLRSPPFSYSVQTPVQNGYDGAGLGVVAKFLEVKSGYCVHYSAAMAVMARELGIPSRIAVGYAPGQRTAETMVLAGQDLNGFQVVGRDAHAWPELYFEGLGWVPFEPTPSRGAVPSYAQQEFAPSTNPGNENQQNEANPRPSAGPVPTPVPTATTEPPVASSGPEKSGPPLALGFLGLLVLLAPALVRSTVRRRRLAKVRGFNQGGAWVPPEVLAWQELLASAADYGYPSDPALTPAEQAQRLAAVVNPDLGKSVELLRDAYERTVFGPLAPPADALPARDDLADAVERINKDLAGRASGVAGFRAVALPPSFFTRR